MMTALMVLGIFVATVLAAFCVFVLLVLIGTSVEDWRRRRATR